MRLTAWLVGGVLAAGTFMQADETPTPPAPGIVPGAEQTVENETPASHPNLSPRDEPAAASNVIENTAEKEASTPANATTQPPEAAADTEEPVADAPAPSASASCTPRVLTGGPVMAPWSISVCSPSGCGPFGAPPFGDAPGPGTGVAVPPVPPAYLAPGVLMLAPGPVHDRYPYCSYRRPWYTAGPASANVTIIW